MFIKYAKTPIIKGIKIEKTVTSKGLPITWHRLTEDDKKSMSIKTSKAKDNIGTEFGANISYNLSLDWIIENQGTANVAEFLSGLLDKVNRPILADAGGQGLNEVELIADFASLVAYETLETARGRAASRLDGKQFEALLPELTKAVKAFLTMDGCSMDKLGKFTSTRIGMLRVILVQRTPIELTDKIKNDLQAIINNCLGESEPETLDIWAKAVVFYAQWKEENHFEGY